MTEGQVVSEVNGRPVVGLVGTSPLYRSLAVGASGPDVASLEAALARLGRLEAPDDRLDPGAWAALGGLWQGLGYAPPSPDALVNEVVFIPAPSAVVVAALPTGSLVGEEPVASLAVGGLAVRAAVPGDAGGRVEEGQSVSVTDEASGRVVEGEVTELTRRTDPETGEDTVEARVDLPTGSLQPGVAVIARVAVATTDGDVLVVPADAVWTGSGGDAFVYVEGAGGDWVERRVTTGLTAGGRSEVAAVDGELTEGQRLAVERP